MLTSVDDFELTFTIELEAVLSPIIQFHPGESSAMLNFDLLKINILALYDIKCKWIVYPRGLNGYTKLAIDEWIKKSFNRRVLGNGIYMEVNGIVDPKTSTVAVAREGIHVGLNAFNQTL